MRNANGKNQNPEGSQILQAATTRQQPPLSLVCEKMRNELRAP